MSGLRRVIGLLLPEDFFEAEKDPRKSVEVEGVIQDNNAAERARWHEFN